MKRNLITFAAVLGIISGGFIVAHAQTNSGNTPANANANPNQNAKPPAKDNNGGPGHGPFAGHFGGGPEHAPFMLDKFAEKLNLTPEQKAKVQPIFDQAKPQLKQIHEEAMQKMQLVMESTMGQVRTLLTPEQIAQLDAMKQAHENARNAMERMRDTSGDESQ